MKKEDLFILTLALLLLAAILYTIFFGGDKSMHGLGLQETNRQNQPTNVHELC